MKHYGDITKIKGADVTIVDIVTGGSPCQDLSVAGKRAGLAGERSGLFMEQIRIIKEMRDEDRKRRAVTGSDDYIRPRYMVWENVPGAFSSNKGEDFRAVLEETAKVADENAVIPGPPGGKWSHAGCIMGDGWSIAWRVHDAQFWGVPQRRKRIALVADFGGSTAPEILFERESVSGDSEPCGTPREETAGTVGAGIETASGVVSKGNGEAFLMDEKHTSLSIGGGQAGQGYPCVMASEPVLLESNQNHATVQTNGISTALPASMGEGGGYVPMITDNKCLNSWDVQSKHIQPENGIAEALYSGECRGGGGESYVMQNGAISFQERAGKPGGGKGILIQNERVGALSTLNNQMVCGFDAYNQASTGDVAKSLNNKATDTDHIPVVYGISAYESNAMKSSNPNSGIYEAETARTLDLNGGSPACNQGGMAVVQAYRKQGHPQNAEQGQGWEETETNDTLNAFDNGESRTPTIVLDGNGSRSSHRGDGYAESETMYTLNSTEHHAVSYAVESHAQDARYNMGDINQPLSANMEHDAANGGLVFENHGQDSRYTGPLEVAQPVTSTYGMGGNNQPFVVEQQTFVSDALSVENHPNDSRVKIREDGTVQTLSGRMGTGGGNVPMVMEQAIALNGEEVSPTLIASLGNAMSGTTQDKLNVCTYQKTTRALCASGYDKLGTQEAANDMYVVQSSWDGSQVAPTLTSNNANGAQRMPDKDNFNAVIQSMEVYHCTTEEEKVQTLKARDYKDPQVVAYGLDRASYNQGQNAKFNFSVEEEKIGAQVAKGPGAVCQSVVRRLTPMECERLQGYPDHWTDIGEWVDSNGKKHKDADSPRYKALGNSIALPFWQWMAARMVRNIPGQPTMASLFSGIGGFELVFARAGCKPIWNSEIEPYPEAVTKKHFGDGEGLEGDYEQYL